MSSSLANAGVHLNNASTNVELATGYVRDDLSPKKVPFWQMILSTALGEAISIPLKYLPSRTAVVSSVPVTVK